MMRSLRTTRGRQAYPSVASRTSRNRSFFCGVSFAPCAVR
jgi:hypothetical protein